jgi:hypothetical protein
MSEYQMQILREKLSIEQLFCWLPAEPERKQPAPSAGAVQEKAA